MNRIIEQISEEEIINLLKELVKIPSYPGVDGQETGVAKYLNRFFAETGIESKLVHVVDGRNNVIARLKGKGGGRTLLLTGHMDTVPPYDMQDACKPRIENGKIMGRGVVDMKGALACMAVAMKAIKKSGIELNGDVIFAGVIDEEHKSEGTIALLESGLKVDAAIVGEASEGAIGVGHKGLEWFEFNIKGKAVHGGRQKEGINAIAKAMKLIQKFEEELIPKIENRVHPIIGSSTMNYGFIKGGFQPSLVAGECMLQIDRRWIPGERYEDIIKEYQDIIDSLHAEDPEFKADFKVMDVSVMRDGYVHESMEIDLDHPIVELAARHTESVGRKARKDVYTSWSDAGLLNYYRKIPTIVYGPGSMETAHTSNEFLEISELLPFTLIYAGTAVDFCS